VAFLVVGKWDVLRNYWSRLTRGALAINSARPVSIDTEYFCPMCPGVVSDWPTKCPVCNMDLVRRKRGEATPLPNGVVSRMQLSPYRLQLAGVGTSVLEYRPLHREIVLGGFLEAGADAGSGGTPVVRTDIFEKDWPFLSVGQGVLVACEALSGHAPFSGTITKLSSSTGAARRGLRAEISVADSSHELQPAMFVTVRVQVPAARLTGIENCLIEKRQAEMTILGARLVPLAPTASSAVNDFSWLARAAVRQAALARDQVLSLPETALVDTGSQKIVYVETMPGMFDGVEVVVGPRSGDFYPVLRGLEAGQRVVTSGAFLIDAETRLNPSLAAGYFGAARKDNSSTLHTAAHARDHAEELEKLAPADRALATKQKICPVTDEPLGSMGPPVRVEVNGKVIFLCCEGCRPAFQENPKAYLSKLNAK
jgi:hypothetical protein